MLWGTFTGLACAGLAAAPQAPEPKRVGGRIHRGAAVTTKLRGEGRGMQDGISPDSLE